jgi:hypothetical protein
MDKVAEIKRLYLNATRATIAKDIDRAVAILKSIETEDERERAAVFMDGLSQMRSEWGAGTGAPKVRAAVPKSGKRKTEQA